MSAQTSPSPLQAPAADPADETKMPKGHCRYILLLPEIKGQRCACVGFSLNKGIPGATCDCGHLACFHTKEQETTSDRQELENLRKRVQQLEDHFSKGNDDVIHGVVTRLNEMEEHVEKSKEEFTEQIKGTYRNASMNWHAIEDIGRKNKQHDDQLRQIYDKLSDHDQQIQRLQAAQMELQDADLSLEERIENLTETIEEQEEEAYLARARLLRPRRRSTSDTSRPNIPLGPLGTPLGVRGSPLDEYRRSPPSRPKVPDRGEGFAADGTLVPLFLKPLPASARSTGAWTVHISLLPHALVPMPFERNTNAYQRCLSRGLHQVVVVNGPDAKSFTSAVEKAFGSILKGRAWMPLQAKLCDAESLQGLPMLRQLDPQLVDCEYDHEFLRTHAAVCDAGGMIDSLYIAMRRHTISWHMLKHAPVFMEGLEKAWEYDALLDAADIYTNNVAGGHAERPAAGAITTVLPVTSLKRPINEVSRSNSFGSASAPNADTDGPRGPKRPCPVSVPAASTGTGAGAIVEMRRRGVETA